MSFEPFDKVVLITGGANGIGACVVRALVEENVKQVAVLDIAEQSGLDLQNEIKAKYGADKMKFIKCDVTDEEQFSEAFRSILLDKGYIDVVINNAGIMNDSLKMYKKEIDLNVTALITGTLKAIQVMRKDEGGSGGTVINISSVAGLCQIPQLPIYWSTKSAVIQFSNCIGLEKNYTKTGVRVVTVCFGPTETSLLSADKIGHFDKEVDQYLLRAISFCKQRPESAARGVIQAMRLGESGSTWLVSNNEPAKDISTTVKDAYGMMAKFALPKKD